MVLKGPKLTDAVTNITNVNNDDPEVKAAWIKKLLAEANAAEALAALNQAKAIQAAAEEEKAKEEAQNVRQQNVLVTIAAEQAKRAEKDELAADRHWHVYTFNKPVTESTVRECINQLTSWVRKAEEDESVEIEIIFNSPGGSIVDGFALYDYIRGLGVKGHKITTSALGMAASMAGILLQAGETRVMGRQSWLMIHEASFGAVGKIGEVEDTVEWVKKVQERILDIFAEKSTLSKAKIRNRWTRKDWWLSAEEALELGFIDEIR